MKNVFVIAFTVMSVSMNFAQDVKIKKGLVLLDKKEVAKIEKQDKGYKISALNDDASFTAFTTNITDNKNVRRKFWLELTGTNGNIREVEYDKIPFTFSKEKWCVEALLKSNTGLLTLDGINSQLVNEFFTTPDQGISETFDAAVIEQKKEIEDEKQLAKDNKLVVDARGNISLDGKKVAHFSKTIQGEVYKTYSYTVYDSKGKVIAKSQLYRENDSNRDGISIKMFDDTVYPLEQIKTQMGNIDFNDFEQRMVRKIYAKGYNLLDITTPLNK